MMEKNPLASDIELMEKMSSKSMEIWNDLTEWCADNCPYECSCKDFAGACTIQTIKSVANWGHRVILTEIQNQKRALVKRGKK